MVLAVGVCSSGCLDIMRCGLGSGCFDIMRCGLGSGCLDIMRCGLGSGCLDIRNHILTHVSNSDGCWPGLAADDSR